MKMMLHLHSLERECYTFVNGEEKCVDLNSCQKNMYIGAIQSHKISIIYTLISIGYTFHGFVLYRFAHIAALCMLFCWFRAAAIVHVVFQLCPLICCENAKVAADLQV